MKKVAVVTLFGNYNLGNKLQNYAVIRIFDKLGMEGHTITYALSEIRASGHRENLLKETMKKILCAMGVQWESIVRYRLKKQREAVFRRFTDAYLNPGELVSFSSMPDNMDQRYDLFSVGSDQVWHNWTDTKDELEYFFLRFCSPEKRLNIAPSFGRENLPEKWKEIYKKGLNGFRYLSCRESSGIRIIKELTGRDAKLLLDPTMAIKREEWECIEAKPTFEVPQRYVLVYFLGNGREQMLKAAREYARSAQCEVVNIYDIVHSKKYYVTGPREFLYLLHHANFVCSNSFHAIAFSILYNKEFFCFERSQNEGNMNDRIITLLAKFGLESRLVERINVTDFPKIDYETVNRLLEDERCAYIAYLSKTIGALG